MFKTEKDIELFIINQDIDFAEKALAAYNVSKEYIKPTTLQQCEDIMWDVLDNFNLI
jgi:hypothetical protein